MSDNDRHVVPNPYGGLDVRAAGAKCASAHKETQAQAIDPARAIVGNLGGDEILFLRKMQVRLSRRSALRPDRADLRNKLGHHY